VTLKLYTCWYWQLCDLITCTVQIQ